MVIRISNAESFVFGVPVFVAAVVEASVVDEGVSAAVEAGSFVVEEIVSVVGASVVEEIVSVVGTSASEEEDSVAGGLSLGMTWVSFLLQTVQVRSCSPVLSTVAACVICHSP